jgi:hypothetical protein
MTVKKLRIPETIFLTVSPEKNILGSCIVLLVVFTLYLKAAFWIHTLRWFLPSLASWFR